MDKKISFPHMGSYYIPIKYLIKKITKCDVIIPKINDKNTIIIGSKYSPTDICMPFKYNLGDYIDALNKGANILIQAGGGCRYGYYAEDEPNLILEGIEGAKRIKRMMTYLRNNLPKAVAGYKVEKVIDYIKGYDDIPASDVLRFFLENGSWFAVRPSGTEPKIKFYFYSDQKSREKALQVNKAIREDIMATIMAVE